MVGLLTGSGSDRGTIHPRTILATEIRHLGQNSRSTSGRAYDLACRVLFDFAALKEGLVFFMRRMSLTPELVALCHRDEIDPGPSGHWTPLSDEDYQALALRLADEADAGPLWVFAYGSLIWKPAFESVEQQRVSAHGWHRSFCLDILRWRGSPAQPGLMMALERGGRCDGVIYRLPDGEKPAQIERLLRREIDDHESISSVRWVPVRTSQGRLRALGFWVGVTGQGTSLRQPLEKVAWVLARACGHVGSGAEYLYNTVSHLEAFGIHDRNLWRLQELVADEIQSIHGHRIASGEPSAINVAIT